jgi:hypothetical protein
MGEQMKKTVEEQIKVLLAKYSEPPLEVIIPILEKAGRGEQELTAHFYDIESSLTNGIKEIFGLKDKNMKTLAKVVEIAMGASGQKIEPIELSESRFSFSITDCPMIHVGKNVSLNVKSKFCDLICAGSGRAFMDTVLGQDRGTCFWDKSLIKGKGKCRLVFELVKS